MNLKLKNLIEKLNKDLYEREEVVKLTFLALLGGESIFLLGPPGVAKSLVARLIKKAVLNSRNFEYLMNRFSTPEEIFGPISLKSLDDDRYERKVSNYLPDAEIAFLDEIWKASPSIQNTLLTIINEKLFRNGAKDIAVPLQLLIAASNELPAKGEGLEALFDRFLIRHYIDNVAAKDAFKSLVSGQRIIDVEIPDNEKITLDELTEAKVEIEKVVMPDLLLEFLVNIKDSIAAELGEEAPYVSDRRWKKVVWLLKTSAFASDRKEVTIADLVLIQEFIWEDIWQKDIIRKVFIRKWTEFSLTTFGIDIELLLSKLAKVRVDIQEAHYTISEPEIEILADFDGTKREYMIFASDVNPDREIALPVTQTKNNTWKVIVKDEIYQNVYVRDYAKSGQWTIEKKYLTQSLTKGANKLVDVSSYLKEGISPIAHEKVFVDIVLLEKSSFGLSAIETEIKEIADKKDEILKKLKSQNVLLVHSFDYEVELLSQEVSQTLKKADDERMVLERLFTSLKEKVNSNVDQKHNRD